jgi:hypothetical protein
VRLDGRAAAYFLGAGFSPSDSTLSSLPLFFSRAWTLKVRRQPDRFVGSFVPSFLSIDVFLVSFVLVY